MSLDITNLQSFNQARRVIIDEIENNNGIVQNYTMINNDESSKIIARAISVITSDQSKADPILKTAMEKKLLFAQLTQRMDLSPSHQQQIIYICIECIKNNTFKTWQNNGEFEALSSIGLGASLPRPPGPKLPREQLYQLDLAQMYNSEPTPHFRP